MGTKQFDSATDLITFSRASGGTALRKISYGSELVTNGTFDSDTDWTKGGSWTISGGVATQPSGASANYITQADILVVGKTYAYSVTVTSANGSNFAQLYTDAGVIRSLLNGAATYTGTFTAAGNDLRIRAVSSTLDVSVDNISVKEVLFDQADGELTLFNHPDDIPRIEYAANGSVKGLLIEEQRTNYVADSKTFGIAATGATASVTTSTTEPYYSGDTVKRITASAVNEGGDLNFSAALSGDHYCSFYVRSRTGAEQSLKITTSGTVGVTQTVPASGEWVRLGRIGSLGAGSRDMRVLSVGDPIDVDVCSPQAEFGAFPTSYIPTSGSTATRSADIATIPVADFGYNQKAGTVLVEFEAKNTSNVNVLRLGTKSSYDNGLDLAVSSGSLDGAVWFNNTKVASYNGASVSANTGYKMAATVKPNDVQFAVDGSTSVVDTNASINPAVTLLIGDKDQNALFGAVNIKSIQYYPRRLSDAQLQSLTQPAAATTLSLTFDGLDGSSLTTGLHP